jgi:hypothetical protein
VDFFPPFDQIGVSPPGPWQNANPAAGLRGSIPNADLFPAIQNEILNVQDEAGITRNASNFTQLLRAIRGGQLTFFADTGTADALIITPRTAHSVLSAGLPFVIVKGNSANATTAPTLSVNGLVQTIVRRDGSPLAVGDLPASSFIRVRSDGAHFRTEGLCPSDVANTSVFNSFIAQTSVGRAFAVFGSNGTWTCPAGVYYAKFRLWGGGGGSGGASSGAASAGAGGAGYSERWFAVTPGTTYAITIGAGGTGGSAGLNGNNGGTTSVASLISATGGSSSGGATSGASTAYGAYGNGFGGLNFGGVAGTFAQTIGTALVGGTGGAAMFSTGPAAYGAGNFPGGGAAGSVGPAAGNAGQSGLVIIEF